MKISMIGDRVMIAQDVRESPAEATPSLIQSHVARELRRLLKNVSDNIITRYEHRLAQAIEEKLNAPSQAHEQSSKRHHDEHDETESSRKHVRVSHTGHCESIYDDTRHSDSQAAPAALQADATTQSAAD